MRSAKRIMHAYDSRNPGAKACIATAPAKHYQWRYKLGFALVRCQHFENMGNAKKPSWKHLKTYQMPKATANRQIKILTDDLGWKIKLTY